MEVLRRAEKMATEAYPEATRDPNKVFLSKVFLNKYIFRLKMQPETM